MQPAADEDFEIEVKFESEPTQAIQSQGLLVEQDATNFIRFDVYSDGSSLNVFGAAFTDGSPDTPISRRHRSGVDDLSAPRTHGDQWTARYSYDGVTWTTAGTFSHALTVWSVGVFAGNFDPNPAYTAVVDYFFETSAPVLPEDASLCNPSDESEVTTASIGGGSL